MEQSEIVEQIKKYPYLKDIENRAIITDIDDIFYIKKGKSINLGQTKVYSEVIERILSNDNYFSLAKKFFNNEITSFKIATLCNGDLANIITYSKTEIVKAMEKLVFESDNDFFKSQQKRLEILKQTISKQKFIEKNKNKIYTTKIDGKEYSFSVSELIDIMEMDSDKFEEICVNKKITQIGQNKKEHAIFAAFEYFFKNKVLENYLFDQVTFDRFEAIESLQLIDIQAINKCLDPIDDTFKKIKVDKNLEEYLLQGLPKKYNDLEKAIYIYLKMCKTFSYDKEYYALLQKGVALEKHKDYNYISTITKENNELVCFEFNTIYAKLLNDLNILFKIEHKQPFNTYGVGHQNLTFRVNKFLVRADSTLSILNGDLLFAKLNQPINGLTCYNKNTQTQLEFVKALKKVYLQLAKQETSSFTKVKDESFSEILKEYQLSTKNYKSVPIDEKIDIMLKKIYNSKLKGVDILGYLFQLRKILFSSIERERNCQITIARHYVAQSNPLTAYPIAIIALNEKNFELNENENRYYILNPTNPKKLIQAISKNEIQSLYDNLVIDFIFKDSLPLIVPGIKKSNNSLKK